MELLWARVELQKEAPSGRHQPDCLLCGPKKCEEGSLFSGTWQCTILGSIFSDPDSLEQSRNIIRIV